MDPDFSDNAAQSRYEYRQNGGAAYANYRREGATLFIDYVYSPPELRGTGAAGALMKNIMETAAAQKTKVVPICGYAASWVARHPEYKNLAG